MTPEETQRVEALTAHMSTRCVGRYLIDMPQSFVLNSESSTEIEGVKIQVKPMDKRLFEMTLAGREAQLNRETIIGTYYGHGVPSLLKVHRLPANEGVVFDRSRSRESPVLRTQELMARKGDYLIQMYVDSRDLSQDIDKPDPADTRKTDTPEKLAHLLKVYERVSGRKDTEIPTEQGVCFANGFVKGPPTDEEVLFVRHDLENAPDVGSTFHSLSNITEDTELLDRSAAIEADLKERSGRTLRKGKSSAQISGAQEWLMTKKSRDSGLMMQAMTLEANSKIGSAATPVVIFHLNAGGGYRTQPKSNEEAATRTPLTKNTFSEAEAMAIWDKLSATLRPRPGAF